MSVTIAGIEFEHHVYDERADVLYLTVAGYEGQPADADATLEGYGIEYDEAEGDRDDARERQVAARPRRGADDHLALGTRQGRRTRCGAGVRGVGKARS